MTDENVVEEMIVDGDLETVRMVHRLAEKLIKLNMREADAMAKATEKVRERFRELRRDTAAEFPERVRKLAGVE